MDIYDINQLVIDSNTGLYDLTRSTYQYIPNITTFTYVVEQHEEMRIDLVCNSIYGSTDYVDFLLNYNSIDNPLNVKSGDSILYIDAQYISQFRVSIAPANNVQNILLNPAKVQRVDSNRSGYIEQSFSLPPTINDDPVDQVKVDGNNIVIGDGFF
jgi:hypothetical protein